MVSKKPKQEGINNKSGHITYEQEMMAAIDPKNRTVELGVFVTPFEKEFLEKLAHLLSKININGQTIIPTDTISDLLRLCFNYTAAVYQGQIFPDSTLVTRLPDKDSIKEFMAFRKKYMGYALDAQIQQLKEMGIVRSKQN